MYLEDKKEIKQTAQIVCFCCQELMPEEYSVLTAIYKVTGLVDWGESYIHDLQSSLMKSL